MQGTGDGAGVPLGALGLGDGMWAGSAWARATASGVPVPASPLMCPGIGITGWWGGTLLDFCDPPFPLL